MTKGKGPSLREYLMGDATASSCAGTVPAPMDVAAATAAGTAAGVTAAAGATESPAAADTKSPPPVAMNRGTCCSAWLSIVCAIVPHNAARLAFSIDTVGYAPCGEQAEHDRQVDTGGLECQKDKGL